MTIIGDLNATALVTSLVTLLVCASYAGVAIFNRRKRRFAGGIGRYLILLAGLFCCGFLGLNTLDNASDARQASFTGQVKIAGFQYGPRGAHINLYRACATNCDASGVLFVMEPKAQIILRDHPDLSILKIKYLAEKMNVGPNEMAFKVVDISDPSKGTPLYRLDTSHHPWRAGLYFTDAAFFLLTGLLDFLLIVRKPC
jgi:hypothetical protein